MESATLGWGRVTALLQEKKVRATMAVSKARTTIIHVSFFMLLFFLF